MIRLAAVEFYSGLRKFGGLNWFIDAEKAYFKSQFGIPRAHHEENISLDFLHRFVIAQKEGRRKCSKPLDRSKTVYWRIDISFLTASLGSCHSKVLYSREGSRVISMRLR